MGNRRQGHCWRYPGGSLRNVENIIGGSGSDTINGDALANRLVGGAGGDILKGGLGADFLDGGIGSDTADFSDKSSAVAVTLDGSTTPWRLSGVSQKTSSATSKMSSAVRVGFLTGDGLANLIRGGAGADILDGGGGVDTADYRDKTLAVVVTLGGAAGSAVRVGSATEDTIRNFENVLGGSAGDTLTGDDLANFLGGNDGADFLAGGLGNDVLDGGAGIDSADFREKSGAISVTLNGAANAQVIVNGIAEDTLRNVENIFSGSGADTLTGDGLVKISSVVERGPTFWTGEPASTRQTIGTRRWPWWQR